MLSRKLMKWAASLAILPLVGCATQTIPVTETSVVEALPPIKYHDYCSAQKGIAEHNSRWETLKTKTPVVFKAPCELDQKAEPKKIARAK
jgi:hypothetical protein